MRSRPPKTVAEPSRCKNPVERGESKGASPQTGDSPIGGAPHTVCHSGKQTPENDGGHWTAEEIAWAKECFRCGERVSEIAATAGRHFLDVAMAMEVYGFVSRERRWQPSTPGAPRRFVGGMVREVAAYRYARHEDIGYLARLAGVGLSTMYGLLKDVRRLPQPEAPLIAAARRALAFIQADRDELIASSCVLDPATHEPDLSTLDADTASFLAGRHDGLIAELRAALARPATDRCLGTAARSGPLDPAAIHQAGADQREALASYRGAKRRRPPAGAPAASDQGQQDGDLR